MSANMGTRLMSRVVLGLGSHSSASTRTCRHMASGPNLRSCGLGGMFGREGQRHVWGKGSAAGLSSLPG